MANNEDDESTKDNKTDGSDENFGLPELEYKPLEEQAPKEEPVAESTPTETEAPAPSTPTESFESYSVDESKSRAPLIITIVIILVVAVAGYLIYSYVYLPGAQEKEKARKELAAKQEAERKAKAEQEARDKEEAERRRLEAEKAKATPPAGTIEVLSARTKRYYVIVTSDVDDDLLMDYARKLSATGVSTKVIPPFGGKQFYRLAIADHDTFAQAQTSADASKASYGNGVWVLKY